MFGNDTKTQQHTTPSLKSSATQRQNGTRKKVEVMFEEGRGDNAAATMRGVSCFFVWLASRRVS